jgi:hypothetical protein
VDEEVVAADKEVVAVPVVVKIVSKRNNNRFL